MSEKIVTPSLSDRMKGYENINRNYLMRRTPAIIRIDGKAFHTWTAKLKKPFDAYLTDTMVSTMKYLVDNIQGAVFGYTQSDEISIFLRDYDTLTTEMWFGGNIQKIVSISSSMATAHFNNTWRDASNAETKTALFDSRVFSLPKEEVTNYFMWRQNDAVRNSIQMIGQHYLGHKKIQGLNNTQVQELLNNESVYIDEFDLCYKHGVCYAKNSSQVNWKMSLIREDKEFINNLVYIKE